MTKSIAKCLLVAALAAFWRTPAFTQPLETFKGRWELVRERSSSVDPWRRIQLDIGQRDGLLIVHRLFSAGRYHQTDSLVARLDGKELDYPVSNSKWLEQPHLAAYPPEGAQATSQFLQGSSGRQFYLKLEYPLKTSQGTVQVTIDYRFRVSADGSTLWLTELRSSRPTPLSLVFRRVD